MLLASLANWTVLLLHKAKLAEMVSGHARVVGPVADVLDMVSACELCSISHCHRDWTRTQHDIALVGVALDWSARVLGRERGSAHVLLRTQVVELVEREGVLVVVGSPNGTTAEVIAHIDEVVIARVVEVVVDKVEVEVVTGWKRHGINHIKLIKVFNILKNFNFLI